MYAKHDIFQKEFTDELLKIYRECEEIIKNNPVLQSKQRNQEANAISQVGNLIAQPLQSYGGPEGQTIGNIAANSMSTVGVLYAIWKEKTDTDKIQDASKFLKDLNVKDKKELKLLAEKIADHLYRHFHNTIEKLYCAPGDTEGVVRFAHFFVLAIAKNIMENNVELNSNKLNSLLRAAIPKGENDSLFNSYKVFATKLKRAKTNNDKNNDKVWTIKGVLFHAPACIGGEITPLESPNTKKKYAPIVFCNKQEANDFQYKVKTEELAPVRDLTRPEGKISLENTAFYFTTFSCREEINKQDKLRFAVKAAAKKGEDKQDAIETLLKKDGVNINCRGRANSVCSYFQGIRDQTPLMIAASFGDLKMVQFLIKQGANYDLVDSRRCTALDYAIKKKHVEIARTLRGYGAKQNKTKECELEALLGLTSNRSSLKSGG